MTDPTRASPQECAEYALRRQLNAVLVHRSALRDLALPVPPAVEYAIGELRRALGLDPPADPDPPHLEA